jgi:hypothetical protein
MAHRIERSTVAKLLEFAHGGSVRFGVMETVMRSPTRPVTRPVDRMQPSRWVVR